jgi:hypothetical protein
MELCGRCVDGGLGCQDVPTLAQENDGCVSLWHSREGRLVQAALCSIWTWFDTQLPSAPHGVSAAAQTGAGLYENMLCR